MSVRHTAAGSPSLPRVSYLVFRLERRIRARLDEALARHGVTTTEFMALSELRARDGLSSAQLARIAFVTPQAMNLVIRDLEQRELIRRTPDPGQRRVLRTSLTRKGLSTLQRCDRALDGIEAVMLGDVDDTTRKTLAQSLTECALALRTNTAPGADAARPADVAAQARVSVPRPSGPDPCGLAASFVLGQRRSRCTVDELDEVPPSLPMVRLSRTRSNDSHRPEWTVNE